MNDASLATSVTESSSKVNGAPEEMDLTDQIFMKGMY